MLGAADLDIFWAIRGIFHTTALIWTVKVPYQKRKWPCWISSSMIRTFQTGNGSYVHHLDVLAACNQISKPFREFPAPDVTNALPDLFHCPFQFFSRTNVTPITYFSVCSPLQSQGFWGTYLSDLRLSKIFLNPLWPLSFHSSPSIRLGTFQTGCGFWADMLFYSSRSYNRQHLLVKEE